ncbi:hypothetical protein GGX14DRAFT_374847 [Mycena pura]|uniref:SWIM-type domain-containing protein n=1 Tax=Mycena pura TaxID=153505 RepID=A0AAD6Y5G0_9AGAR|nr:hypothetical protein GGX14DRAFT_374847 [Mycena pura]
MVRFPCHGRLTIISSRQKDSATRIVSVNLKHAVPHVAYYDVSLPAEAADIIRENMEWCTPSELVKRIQARFPSATANQIGDAWRSLSEMFWKRDTDQLASALKLLAEFPDEVDIFKLQGVPDGVEILGWGMKKIAMRLSCKIMEIAIDATYNTNARQLELYGVLAKYDNAGFPLAYCLLSTASSIAISKRKLALTAFGNCLRDTYGVNPEFAHTDKDMAEIGMLKDVWDPKINQCWWHVDDAVGKRLKSAKLSTTPYDSQRAHTEFSFIDMSFFEGGYLEPVSQAAETHNPSKLTFVLPPSQLPPPPPAPAAPRLDANGIPLLRIPVLHCPAGEDVEMAEEEDTKNTKRTFCRAVCRDPIRAMMKPHAFAHPLIPGYCHPSKEGIKYWAVKQAYDYCVEHDLREVWAYLWRNWYRSGRWELWARSAHPTIPRLRTTMICESHWRRIKHDFLHHFHSPRVDLLVWILVTKLAPTYYRKLDNLLIDTGRYRELMFWRKTFKAEWRKAETRDVNEDREDHVYRPDVELWVCACPAFLVSRFMICKHLVQMVHRVPARFFQQAERSRTTPFWKHPDLISLSTDTTRTADTAEDPTNADMDASAAQHDGEAPDDEDDDLIIEAETDEAWAARTATFDEELGDIIKTLKEFTLGLEHQMQFKERRMVDSIQRHGGGFLKLAQQCLEKERRANTNRGAAPKTWENTSTMFYYPRPTGDRAM